MAEIWAAAVATVAVGYMGAEAQKDAANQASQGAGASIAEERRQYDQTRRDQLPFLDAGYDALNRQMAALEGDFSGFEESPDYAYARQEMIQGADRSAAARGGLYGGGHQADLAERIGGLASQNFNNYWNRLAGRAGQGQVSAQNLAGLGANMAGNIGNYNMQNSLARGQAATNTAGIYGQAIGGLAGMAQSYYNNRPPQQYGGTYTGNGTGAGSMSQFGNNPDWGAGLGGGYYGGL